jgi:hypothetical protein
MAQNMRWVQPTLAAVQCTAGVPRRNQLNFSNGSVAMTMQQLLTTAHTLRLTVPSHSEMLSYKQNATVLRSKCIFACRNE